MAIRERMSGNEVIATAMRQINPDVMGAFPITPSTEIPEYFSQFMADGRVDTRFVPVESEHSAMSVCIGASAAGARAVTATSSCGLAYMWELLYVASSSRLPITMCVANRALTGPISIGNDHSDSMGARDSGWMQIYAEDNQEVYDNFIQAILIAEAMRLPIMVCQDGFITSHGVSNIELIEDQKVREFVGEYEPDVSLLDHDRPLAVGPYGTAPYYMEVKRQQAQAMKDSMPVIDELAAGALSEGKKVGLIKLRVFRPFPRIPLAEAMCRVRAVAVMDKAESFSNSGGPLFNEARSALYDLPERPYAINYIYGLGGRDITVEDFYEIFNDLFIIERTNDPGDVYRYVGVRDSRYEEGGFDHRREE